MYIQSFKYNLENRPKNDFHLISHADVKPNEHRGQYNVPIVDDVAVLLIDELQRSPRYCVK